MAIKMVLQVLIVTIKVSTEATVERPAMTGPPGEGIRAMREEARGAVATAAC